MDVPIRRPVALPRGLSTVPAPIRIAFLLAIALSIFLPFVPIAGPFSLDDLLPLVAVAIALPVLFMRQRPVDFDATVVAFGAFILIAVATSAINAQLLPEFFRLAGRSAGRLAFYLALIVGTRATIADDEWPKHALTVFVVAAMLETAFCLYAYVADYSGPYGMGVTGFAQWSVLRGKTRIQGTFSGEAGTYEVVYTSANFLAAYLVMSIPVTAGLMLWSKRRLVRVMLGVATILQVATVYLTFTRAALIALGCSVLVMGWFLGKRRLAALVLVAGVVGALSVPAIRKKFFQEKHDRFALYYAAASVVADHPITGVGDGNYLSTLHNEQRYYWNPLGSATTTSHNSVLLSAANHGVLGGLAHAALYLFVLLACVRAVGRSKGRTRALAAGVATAIVGYLVQDQFNDLAYVPKVATQAWFLFAVLWVIPNVQDPGRKCDEVRAGAHVGEDENEDEDDDAVDQEQGAAPGLRRVGNG